MPSLFNPADNLHIIHRINKLQPGTPPEWGKMTISQMLAHCQQPLLVALGELKLKRGLIGVLFGKMAKKSLMAEAPFKQNLPTDKSFIIKGQPKFEDEKARLIKLVEKIKQVGPNGITIEPHPFFGKMSTKEWDLLLWKHLDHHLRQFGA